MNQHVDSAAPQESENQESGTAIATIPEYSKTETALAELEHRLASVVYDVTTVKGMDAAKKDRAELRGLRTGLEKTRKGANAEDQARIAARNEAAGTITERIRALEDPIDQQIKKREEEQQKAREERERAEAERLRAINDAIAAIERMPVVLLSAGADDVRTAIEQLEADPLEPFDDVHRPTAEATRDATLATLRTMLATRVEHEEREANLRAEREELDRLRAEQAERDRLAEEQRQADAAERQRQTDEAAEADRQRRAADDHIEALRAIPSALVGQPSAVLISAITEVNAIDPNDPKFGHRRVDADTARARVLSQLETLRDGAIEQERVAAEQQAERERLEQAAAQQREEQEAREAEARRVEAERVEQERLEAERVEAERREAELAEQQRQAEEAAERQRQQEADAIRMATLVDAATEARDVLVELGHGDHITTRKLTAALEREKQS